MIETVIAIHWSSIVETKRAGGADPIYAIMRVLKCLDDLDREPRRDEIRDGAVDCRTIRANVHCLLDERVRKSRLKMESGEQVISETAYGGSSNQRAQIAAHRRLAQALVVVTWDDHF